MRPYTQQLSNLLDFYLWLVETLPPGPQWRMARLHLTSLEDYIFEDPRPRRRAHHG